MKHKQTNKQINKQIQIEAVSRILSPDLECLDKQQVLKMMPTLILASFDMFFWEEIYEEVFYLVLMCIFVYMQFSNIFWQRWFDNNFDVWIIGLMSKVFNPRSSHTKDSKNGTWSRLTLHSGL